MINNIIAWSIKNKLLVGLLTLALIFGGIWSMTKVPIDAVPDITNNQVQVITQAPNLGTEDIEQFVTYPVELAMGNLPGVEEIRSISRFGLSVVTIVFKEDVDVYWARQQVNERLSEAKNQNPSAIQKQSNTFIDSVLVFDHELMHEILKSENGEEPAYVDFNDKEKQTANITFNFDNSRVYYTLCEYTGKVESKCNIYYRNINEEVLGEAVQLPGFINSAESTNTQPTIGYDKAIGKEILYFVSDRAEGKAISVHRVGILQQHPDQKSNWT